MRVFGAQYYTENYNSLQFIYVESYIENYLKFSIKIYSKLYKIIDHYIENCTGNSNSNLLPFQFIQKELSCCWKCVTCESHQRVSNETMCEDCPWGYWPDPLKTGKQRTVGSFAFISSCWRFCGLSVALHKATSFVELL